MQREFSDKFSKIKISAKKGREKEAENASRGRPTMTRMKERMSSTSHGENSCFRKWIPADIRLTVISLLFRIMTMNVSSKFSSQKKTSFYSSSAYRKIRKPPCRHRPSLHSSEILQSTSVHSKLQSGGSQSFPISN